MKSKDSFIIYSSFYAPISGLSDEQLGRLFRSIFLWNDTEDKSSVSVADDIAIAFGFFVNQFKIDRDKYERVCDMRTEAVNKRWNKYKCIQKNTSEYNRDYRKIVEFYNKLIDNVL